MEQKSPADTVKISIVIVTYNAVHYLQGCLDSIAAQAFRDFEIIILDGGSTDGTVGIIERNSLHIAFWKSEPDNGIYNAMNKAIAHCSGQWLYFLGADDALLEGFSTMAEALQTPNGIYYGDCMTSDQQVFLGGAFNSYKLAKMNICHHAIFYPSAVFELFEYEEQYIVAADHVLNIKCWNHKKFRWIYLPISTAKFRLNGFSATANDVVFKKERTGLVRKYLGFFTYLRLRFKLYKQGRVPAR